MNASAEDVKRLGKVFDSMPLNEQPSMVRTVHGLSAEFTSAHAASKFGLEGWMESLQHDIAPFGITTTIVEPGFFRTALLEKESVSYGELSIEDYAPRTAETQAWWEAQSGQQAGDPAKLAQALLSIASQEQPPRRFVAGADAIALAEQKAADLQAQADAYHDLSMALAVDAASEAGAATHPVSGGPV